jgi:ribosome maturation factor RimP
LSEGRRPDTKQIAQQVIKLLEAELAAGGFDLLDVRVFQGGGRFQIRIYVDLLGSDTAEGGGIALNQVAKASRTAGMLLEEADLFADPYVIEVSSPGVRRPLRKAEHFLRAVGEKIDLKVSGAPRVRGVLQAVEGSVLVVMPATPLAKPPVEDDSPMEDDSPVAAPTPEIEAAPLEPIRVNLALLTEASLDPDFDPQAIINADRRERKESKRQARLEKPGRKKGRPKNRTKDRPENDGGST